MFCSKCGNKSPAGARFCHKCGTKVINDNPSPVYVSPPPQEPIQQQPEPANYAGYPQQYPVQPIMPGYTNFPSPETMQYEAYPSSPPEEKSPEESTPGFAESMDYMFFPSESVGVEQETKKESSTGNTNFIDYPMEPFTPPAPKQEPKVDHNLYYSNMPLVNNPGYVGYQPAPQPMPTPVPPQGQFTGQPIYPELPQVRTVQPAPPQTIPAPVEPIPLVIPKAMPTPIEPIPQVIPQAMPTPIEPIPQVVPQVITTPVETPVQYVELPDVSLPPEIPKPIAVQQNFESPVIPAFPPISPNPLTMPDTDEATSQHSPVIPRQIDPDLLFIDDDDTDTDTAFSRLRATTGQQEPELLFMDTSNSSPYPTRKYQQVEPIPRPMDYTDYQTVETPDYSGFARNPDYDPDMITHVPKRKGRFGLIAIVGIAIVAVAAIAFILITSGSIGPGDLQGTWTQHGPIMGSVVTRLQFNEDGTGRQYRFNEHHQTVEDETPFEWYIEGRNRLVSTLWETDVTVQITTRSGQTFFQYRFEGQEYTHTLVRIAD